MPAPSQVRPREQGWFAQARRRQLREPARTTSSNSPSLSSVSESLRSSALYSQLLVLSAAQQLHPSECKFAFPIPISSIACSLACSLQPFACSCPQTVAGKKAWTQVCVLSSLSTRTVLVPRYSYLVCSGTTAPITQQRWPVQ